MQDAPLLISGIIRHGEYVYSEKKVLTVTPEGVEEATFFEVAKRAEQLAAALTKLGVHQGDRVATFMWNNQAHMEVYFAVPCMGAILHTLNIRLFPDQLVFIINHAEDSVIVVDANLVPAARKASATRSPAVKHIIVHGSRCRTARFEVIDYESCSRPNRPVSSGPTWTR
jgi:fatty-acyl-CoA synthase